MNAGGRFATVTVTCVTLLLRLSIHSYTLKVL